MSSRIANAVLPVFRGLDDVAIAGKMIAAIAGVTPPTYSKWRSGRAKTPENKLVLLTLLLAHWIDELQIRKVRQANPKIEARFKCIRRCLYQQEVINQALSPEAVREGSHLFRQWWFQAADPISIAPKMAS